MIARRVLRRLGDCHFVHRGNMRLLLRVYVHCATNYLMISRVCVDCVTHVNMPMLVRAVSVTCFAASRRIVLKTSVRIS